MIRVSIKWPAVARSTYLHEMGFTTASAPWWFVAALAGGLTIVSTTTGAMISFWSTRASDNRKSESERSVRDAEAESRARDALRDAAAAMLVEARQVVRDFRDCFRPVPVAEGNRRFIATEQAARVNVREVYKAYWNLVLLGDEQVDSAARELLDATRAFDLPVSAGEVSPLDSSEFSVAYTRHIAARRALVRVAKPKVGLRSPG